MRHIVVLPLSGFSRKITRHLSCSCDKVFDKCNLGRGVLLGDSLGVQFPVAGKSWRQESGAAGHAASIEEARSE